MNTFFITGTDTDVGKTVTTRLILEKLSAAGKRSLGIKPISAGCEVTASGLRNDDALHLQEASSVKVDYEVVNPITFKDPIAPHLAAAKQGYDLTLYRLQDCLDEAKRQEPSYLLIEGAGGWRLPLNSKGQFYSDFALQNQMQVIMVVGMRLGCLNHAVLTYQAIKNDGLKCVGWVANQLSDNMLCYQENLDSLTALLPIPLIAEVPFQPGRPKQIKSNEAFSNIFR